MKKVIFLILFLYFFSISYAQNIYHGNVILISQESVDNFGAWDYDEIDGELIIHPYSPATETDISDLSALLPLKKVKKVQIEYNPHLKNLHGLDSLQYVKKKLWITDNDSLQSLIGLNNISQALDDNLKFYIGSNKQLASLDGFPSGIKKLGEISLFDNENLSDISALENIDSVRSIYCYRCKFPNLQALDNLINLRNLDISYSQIIDIALPNITGKYVNIEITDNPLLKSISGFNQISDTLQINSSNIRINNNPSLESISGFKNIKHFSEIIIENNENLLIFNDLFNSIQTIDYQLKIKQNPRLKSFGPFPNPFPYTIQNIEISNNDSLNSVVGLMGAEKVTNHLELYKNPKLGSLQGLDSLTHTGTISFSTTNISSLLPLKKLDSVDFKFFIHHSLGKINTLEGLENLSYIQYGFRAYNKNLKDISALMVSPTYSGYTFTLRICDSLNSTLNISDIYAPDFIAIYDNPSIKNITGFSNIDSLHRGLRISNNVNLETITCLENLKYVKTANPSSIYTNPSLTNISGLCNLFTQGTIAGTIDIHDNATGFNSVQEIKDWCITPTEDLPTWDAISVYPNPTSDAFQLEVPMDLIKASMMVDLVDISGTSHFSERIKNTISVIPVYNLPPGLYFLRIVFDGRMVQVKKLVVDK